MTIKPSIPVDVPPVDHAVATQSCATCGAVPGVACKVEIRGRIHDGAHRARLVAARNT